MFVFGHTGLTLGAIYLLDFARRGFREPKAFKFDIRIVLFLSLLPDVIDKLLGHLILHDTLNSGRLIAHTMLFFFVATVILSFFKKANWPLYSLSIMMHHILDKMFLDPEIYLWPFISPRFSASDWVINDWIHALLYDPFVITSELLGLSILILLVIVTGIYKPDNLIKVIKYGRVY